jgi:hypothetical protein
MCGSKGNTNPPPPKPSTQFNEVGRNPGVTAEARPVDRTDDRARASMNTNANVISSTDDQTTKLGG